LKFSFYYFIFNAFLISLAQKRLKQLKNKISTQSKKNFLLERDVRYLDARIALLIQNRKAQEAEVFFFFFLFFEKVKKIKILIFFFL